MNKEINFYKIVMLVENKPAVIARVSSLLAGKGYNISYFLAQKRDAQTGEIIVIMEGDQHILERMRKQLLHFIDVIEISEIIKIEHDIIPSLD